MDGCSFHVLAGMMGSFFMSPLASSSLKQAWEKKYFMCLIRSVFTDCLFHQEKTQVCSYSCNSGCMIIDCSINYYHGIKQRKSCMPYLAKSPLLACRTWAANSNTVSLSHSMNPWNQNCKTKLWIGQIWLKVNLFGLQKAEISLRTFSKRMAGVIQFMAQKRLPHFPYHNVQSWLSHSNFKV